MTKNSDQTDAFPRHLFHFVSYNQLESRLPKLDETSKMRHLILTRCVGSVGDIIPRGDSNKCQNVRRKIDIENLNGNVIEFTMWDEMAENFDRSLLETMEQPVIITILFEDLEKEKLRNRFPLKTLLKQNPDSYKGVRFSSKATIIGINTSKDWYYISYGQCIKKANEEDGSYRFMDHGPQPRSAYTYPSNKSIFTIDESATAPLTFFTPASHDVTCYTCQELVEKHRPADPRITPL
ncbi:nucleic acid-binding, OB-fold protein [Tanacetum coccineum]